MTKQKKRGQRISAPDNTRFCHIRNTQNAAARQFTMAFRVVDDTVHFGYGYVSDQDQFNRRIGRLTSVGRLTTDPVIIPLAAIPVSGTEASTADFIAAGVANSAQALRPYEGTRKLRA
jgi:hypothetical protein